MSLLPGPRTSKFVQLFKPMLELGSLYHCTSPKVIGTQDDMTDMMFQGSRVVAPGLGRTKTNKVHTVEMTYGQASLV